MRSKLRRVSQGAMLVIGLAVVVVFATAADKSHESKVTFTKDVAPILYNSCVQCHRPGEMAPMSLLSYKEVRPWAKSIREKVVSREMPPWFADPAHGQFINDPRLKQAEIETIRAWVDSGAIEGNPKDLPPVPKFNDTAWKFGQPDVVLSMTEEASIPADGTVPYRYYVVPTNFTEDKYVQFAQIKRGEPSVVHHVIIGSREPGSDPLPPAGEIKFDRERFNPEAARDPQQATPANNPLRRGSNPDGQIIGWAPGMSPLTLAPGQAKLVKKGSVLIFQMHYTTNGVAAKDRTSVGLWFAKTPVEKRMVTKGVSTDPRKLVIPAGDSNFETRSSMTFTEDIHIYSFMPHMHVRGKDFQYKLVLPDGTEKMLLRVPKYDFNWQLSYFAKEPIAVPKGSRIECVAHHDNSAGNKFNPDPTIIVRWGDQTWEEMMIGWIDYTIDSQNLSLHAQTQKE
ncbi:MAG TPA: thiol-disulfide isomerase [Blastocatellia bacterium]|nr:thiol-disulfide isomerase [Blastocatellia bacterium]